MPAPADSARPTQVTVAGWTAAIASVFLLISVFDTMGSLHTVDMREEVTRALSSGQAKDLGISVDDALAVMRWCLFVAGAAAAASAILGGFVLQRNSGARIGLSVVAVPIVLTAPITGTFLGMFVAAGAAVLWTRPARDWFAGRPVTQRREPDKTVQQPGQQPVPAVRPGPPPSPGPSGPSGPPAPTYGWGAAQGPPGPPVPPLPGPPFPAGSDVRVRGALAEPAPRQVRIACILTWVFSGLAAAGALLLLMAVAVDRGVLVDELEKSSAWDSDWDVDVVVTVAVVVSIVLVVWSLLASALAVLTWRGATWAWVAHAVSTGAATAASVAFLPVSVLHLVALAVSLTMLLGRPSREWFARRSAARSTGR